jgi:alkanesulfonate monooxygenase SsuD/methylene tetrahydromethanopterin reductase-like flavin-dependent oxidoreductase (luciferase family)
VKTRAAKLGRNPEHVKVLPGFSPLVGRTEAEAQEKFDFLQSLVHPVVAREYVSLAVKADLSKYPLDGPMPDLPRPNGSHSSYETTMALARRENLTIRQLGMRMAAARQRVFVKGTAAQIADHMENWFNNGAADGFNIMPPVLPGSLDDFVNLVVPELQRRGLFRTEYEGTTLRENLGLPQPESRYARAAAETQRA